MSFDYSQLDSLESASIDAAELPTHGFPHPSKITLATINYYDNGADTRGKWHSSRYALNWQLFTLTEPFTPSKKLSAWSGATQMHDPDFFVHYLEAKNHAKNMRAECWEFYCALYRDSFQMVKDGKCKDRPLLGQFISKFPGTTVHYGSVARMWWDEFDELTVEIYLDRTLLATVDVNLVANNAKDPKNLLRGNYDPNKLWVSRGNKKGKADV
jgi:hypothetical protein